MNEIQSARRGEAHGKSVDVDFVDVEPLRLEKDLVALSMRKAHDLVFQRRAVPRARSPGSVR